ncbi:unnamed protein product [Hymenolepis diminuta]|uniref:Chromo domain-containing protein n=2 Tax=Hymenolepis diminuta TaxID=6216 RepID=A0A0R3SAN7_HYMDI|nr:unnamed protein product [Hymenolepis diminuta]VUZ39149.1 unnamed protein product [Hymenolepis diminuta]
MRPNKSSKHKRKTEQQFFQVEAILDERRVNDQLTYKVRWVGYPSSEDTWEPEENLVGVRDLIDQFHKQKRTSSPSSVTSQSSRKRHAGSSNESNSSKSRQNSPSSSNKRRATKSRSGYYEYVPQNQLVASKTQFFNDISEGKVDLTSDLYSRVKNRRRHHQDESLSRPSSLSEMNDYKGGSSMTPPTRHSEPSTPKIFIQNSRTPSERAESVASICSHVQITKGDVDKTMVKDDCSTTLNSKTFVKPQPSPVNLTPPSSPERPEEPLVNFSVEQEPLNISKEVESPRQSLTVEEKIEEQSNDGLQYEVDSPVLVADIEEPCIPRRSVQSAQKLMTIYRDLHTSEIKDGSNLLQFPEVCPYTDNASIRSLDDLLFAINNHHWTLLATQPIETMSMVPYPGSQHPLVAALIGGEGRPFLLRRLLQTVRDPNFIDPVSKWPLLVIAVFYGRIQAVKVLLDQGANPNSSIMIDGRHRTALGVAIATGNVDMVSLLILNRANLYKVNGDMTSMQFIDQLIIAATPKTHHDIILKPSTKYGINKDAARHQYSILSRDPTAIPFIEPPNDIYLPRSPYLTALTSSVVPQAITTSLYMSFDGQISKIPSAESLQCIYRLISSLHARLFLEIDRVVSQWLRKVEMATVSVVDKGQWICLHEDSFKITFPTPINEDPSTVYALFLIHGTVTPPGCYHLWLGDDGPCFVDKVFLGVEQRPLDRLFFVSTLFPLKRSEEHQSVSVFLAHERQKSVCIVPLVLRLKPVPKTTPILAANDGIQPELPRLRQRQ